MRLIHARLREIDIIGRHKRKVHSIRHLDKAALCQAFGLWRATVFRRMALKLNIEPVAEHIRQRIHQRLRRRVLPRAQKPPHRAVWPASQTNQIARMRAQLRQRHLRQLAALVDIKTGVELHQMFIARLALGEQNNRRWRAWPLTGLKLVIPQINLTADDRLKARALGRFREFKRTEHIVRVRHRHSGHPHVRAKLRQLLQPHRPLQKRVFGMDAQMDESGCIAHGETLAAPRQTEKHKTHSTSQFACRPRFLFL